jgi:hypothetical protein
MVPEDLLFWIAPMAGTPHDDQNVLCLRHADAMSVPRGWTLDDRREEIPRLFMPRRARTTSRTSRRARTARPDRGAAPEPVEQLVIDGTGEIERPALPPESADPTPVTTASSDPVGAPDPAGASDPIDASVDDADPIDDDVGPWRPSFDDANDLDGLLEVSSPLLARAFRGTDRPRA